MSTRSNMSLNNVDCMDCTMPLRINVNIIFNFAKKNIIFDKQDREYERQNLWGHTFSAFSKVHKKFLRKNTKRYIQQFYQINGILVISRV